MVICQIVLIKKFILEMIELRELHSSQKSTNKD